MILVKITNATEVVASKTHKLFAKMTPEKIDMNLVETEVIKQMSADLASFGLKGQISIVRGIEIEEDSLITKKGFVVKKNQEFWFSDFFNLKLKCLNSQVLEFWGNTYQKIQSKCFLQKNT